MKRTSKILLKVGLPLKKIGHHSKEHLNVWKIHSDLGLIIY
jgi:hypothetical protein